MRKTIAAATVAASITAGGIGGALLGAPGLAAAAETTTGAAGWVREALSGLVDDGTIDQEQADAVASALEEARPEVGMGHHGRGGHPVLSTVADALDVSEDDLRSALREGRTIAEVAADQGVEAQAVMDAIVAAQRERLDEAVAAGRLTQERAEERLAGAEERATEAVNGALPMPRGDRGGDRGGFPGWDRDEGAGDDTGT